MRVMRPLGPTAHPTRAEPNPTLQYAAESMSV